MVRTDSRSAKGAASFCGFTLDVGTSCRAPIRLDAGVKRFVSTDRLRPNHTTNDLSKLAPFGDCGRVVRVIVETPKGSRNKYAFEAEHPLCALKKVLPAGMAFPYDFGFVPSTLADDGDPVDVLVLMDEPAFASCLLKCRLIGVIEGEQLDGKKRIRNDRVVAVEQDNHSYAAIDHVDDLGKAFVRELEEFFVNYHELTGKRFKVLNVRGPKAERRLLEAGRRKARGKA